MREWICLACDKLVPPEDIKDGVHLVCQKPCQDFALYLQQGAKSEEFPQWFRWMQSDEADKYRVD